MRINVAVETLLKTKLFTKLSGKKIGERTIFTGELKIGKTVKYVIGPTYTYMDCRKEGLLDQVYSTEELYPPPSVEKSIKEMVKWIKDYIKNPPPEEEV